MSIAAIGYGGLESVCDLQFPSAGTIGRITLLGGNLTLNAPITSVSATTGVITTANHGLTTGSRFRLSGGGYPPPLVPNTDYWAIVVNANELKVADSLDSAMADLKIPLGAGLGAGNLLLNEQRLLSSDPLAVLLAKEIIHPSWPSRPAIADIGPAVLNAAQNAAEKAPAIFAVSNADAATLAFRHVLLMFGSTVSATIGAAVASSYYLTDEGFEHSLSEGQTKNIAMVLRSRL